VKYPETIVRRRAPLVTDTYGDSVRDWANAVSLSIVGVQVQPSESTELTEVGRSPVVTHMRVISPIGTDLDLLVTDRVEWDSVEWQVEGEVAHHKRPSTGLIHHGEATLKRVKG